MAGIYLHIPFCKQACNYCNFHFTTSLRRKNELIAALLKEIALQKNYLEGELVETIYFGGGTPSLLETSEIEQLLTAIKKEHKVSDDAEVTIETNPDDITDEKLSGWKQAGINRLSIGIQSFFEEDLQWMNRAHNAQQAQQCILLAQQHGFHNITIDLIYGTPLLTNEKWKQNVQTALALNIPHLSCYALTVEPKTPLQKLITLHKKEDVNPDLQSEQFLLLMQWLEESGYEHYEISNFAKPGFRSKHNSSYWQGKKYLGLGPSAHSYNGSSRQWNVANNNIYIDELAKGNLSFEIEMLTPVQKTNEYIMTALRTAEGIELNKLDEDARKQVLLAAGVYIQRDLAVLKDDHLFLTKEGKLLADGIAAALFL